MNISGSRLTSPLTYRADAYSPFTLSQNIHKNRYQMGLLGPAIIKELVNTHHMRLLPNTASKLENTWGAAAAAAGGGGRGGGGRTRPKQVVSPNLKTAFSASDPNYPVSRASKTPNNSYITARGAIRLWGDNKMQNCNVLRFLLSVFCYTQTIMLHDGEVKPRGTDVSGPGSQLPGLW